MSRKTRHCGLTVSIRLVVLGGILGWAARSGISQTAVNPASMPRVGTIDERFQAYNVEMLEVTGGCFWKPYKDMQTDANKQSATRESASTPAGMNPNLYEYRPSIPPGSGFIQSEHLLKAAGPVFDIFSYRLYAAVSQRCANMGPTSQTTPDAALSDEWLSRPDKINAFYAAPRDRFEPRKPLWITETADAACGGNPWASTFLDTFRYLDSHARLAQQGVRVIAHNTLASSDYGVLDENTFAPRPNYWAALLWRKLMGATVLKPGVWPTPSLHLYAPVLAECARRSGTSRHQYGPKRLSRAGAFS